ncbi:MAG: DUF4910 domain-containing protein [Deferribacteres bacterium]|nr:DUF4910 domain-containing protein [candidate division KSB1 bacterium]MCB9512414.1 DUF4910 domain-containing protein [Deferribacteres bacterium]
MDISNKVFIESAFQPEIFGDEMYDLICRLYPICRSITGDGVRETLSIIHEMVPIEIHEIKTGTRVFDWTVPKEWNIQDAYIKDGSGRRVVDFKESNLHVVSYSTPVKEKMPLAELKKHLHTIPDMPECIPYRTSYYQSDWGFCLKHKDLLALNDEEYEVSIDADLKDGYMTYGEFFKQGELADEVVFFSHCCHPSMCNDNLSGLAVIALVARFLQSFSLRYSYRFLFAPATIGSITWLAQNENNVHHIKHGLVASNLGDAGCSTYKKSRRGDAEIDKAFQHILKNSGKPFDIQAFQPYGYDERQFCSPGFNLPFGRLTRSPNGSYPEYHTSADNLDFVKPEHLFDSFYKIVSVINILENNKTYQNQSPKCEPQLGKRGLYRQKGGLQNAGHFELALLWILNLSDGQNSLLDIAERSKLDFNVIFSGAQALLDCGLLAEATS